MGDVCKNEESTESEELLDVLDWSQGPSTRTNEVWITMVNKKTCEDIEGVSQQIRSWVLTLTDLQNSNAPNDGRQKEFVRQVITCSATTYFEHLRRRWKN